MTNKDYNKISDNLKLTDLDKEALGAFYLANIDKNLTALQLETRFRDTYQGTYKDAIEYFELCYLWLKSDFENNLLEDNFILPTREDHINELLEDDYYIQLGTISKKVAIFSNPSYL